MLLSRRFVPRLLPLALALLVLVAPGAFPAAEPENDGDRPLVLDGLHRSALVGLLGEPDKAKRSKDGETLTYKLLTVGKQHVYSPDERLIDLPGVGRCVRRIPRHIEGYIETMEFEPTTVTGDGRMEGGEMTQSRTASQTMDLDEPLPKSDEAHDDRTGKIRLIVTLGRDGTVLAWRTKGGR